jgi:hypothetical protein
VAAAVVAAVVAAVAAVVAAAVVAAVAVWDLGIWPAALRFTCLPLHNLWIETTVSTICIASEANLVVGLYRW